MKINISPWWVVASLVILFALFQQCNGNQPPEQIIEKETVVEWKTDTITKTVIDTVYKEVYLDKIITEKGKDSIIYRDVPSETTIEAKQYTTELFSNDATADLKITTTGELIDISGVIEYPEKTITTTITNNIDNSGKFIFVKTDILDPLNTIELGVFAHSKNKIGLIGSVGYNKTTQKASVNGGIAFKF